MKNQNTIQKIAKAQKILRKAKLVLYGTCGYDDHTHGNSFCR